MLFFSSVRTPHITLNFSVLKLKAAEKFFLLRKSPKEKSRFTATAFPQVRYARRSSLRESLTLKITKEFMTTHGSRTFPSPQEISALSFTTTHREELRFLTKRDIITAPTISELNRHTTSCVISLKAVLQNGILTDTFPSLLFLHSVRTTIITRALRTLTFQSLITEQNGKSVTRRFCLT